MTSVAEVASRHCRILQTLRLFVIEPCLPEIKAHSMIVRLSAKDGPAIGDYLMNAHFDRYSLLEFVSDKAILNAFHQTMSLFRGRLAGIEKV